MVLHIVLFEPKSDLGDAARRALVASIERAAQTIPSVRRFEVGRHVDGGPRYQVPGTLSFSFVALVAFDDRAGLEAYLAHPTHEALGRLFRETLARAFIYDYDTRDAGQGLDAFLDE